MKSNILIYVTIKENILNLQNCLVMDLDSHRISDWQISKSYFKAMIQ